MGIPGPTCLQPRARIAATRRPGTNPATRPDRAVSVTNPPEPLADRQAALLRALVADGPTPAGFDADRIAVTARGLRRKRARVVAHVYPALRALPDFESRYADWAERRVPGSAADDGADFALALGPELPMAVAAQLVAARRRRLLRVRDGVVVRLFGVRTWSRPAGRS